jgi:YggT family protein
MILIELITLYQMVVVGSVIMSWLQLSPANPVAQFVRTVTEPVLGPIRRALPQMGGLDLSPMVLIFGLELLKRLLF